MSMSAFFRRYPFRDARSLPWALGSVRPGAVGVALSYGTTGKDGLGAGGWKPEANFRPGA
jgi:hypothetical protein